MQLTLDSRTRTLSLFALHLTSPPSLIITSTGSHTSKLVANILDSSPSRPPLAQTANKQHRLIVPIMNLMSMDPCALGVEFSGPALDSDAATSSLPPPGLDMLFDEGEDDHGDDGGGNDDDDDEAFEHARMQAPASYDFRPSARDGERVFITTWQDADQSGDYDPRFEGKQSNRREGKRPILTRRDSPNGDGDGDGYVQGRERHSNRVRLSMLAARQKGESMVVSLPMSSNAVKTLASTIPDNWPGETWNFLSDEYVEGQARGLSRGGRRTRRTQCEKDAPYPWGLDGVGVPDPFEKEPDLTGHPAARGCVECRSYVHDRSDPTQPCSHCVHSGSHCVAGPGFEGIRERIDIDRDYTKPRLPDPQGRKYISCASCRLQNKKCSLKKKEDVPPCDGCLAYNTSCTFDRVQRIPAKSDRHHQSVIRSPAATNSTRTSHIASAAGEVMPPGAQMINTSLCHPLVFMEDELGRCNWCFDGSDGLHNSKFGILGHGWEDVMVKPSAEYGDRAFDEVCGGHAAQGVPKSAMCSECSMKRVQIIRCEEHEMQVLTELYKSSQQPGQEEEALTPESLYSIDFAGPYQRLEEGTLELTDRFCDLCPSLAMFKCCTIQDSDAWGTPISCELPEAEGCGLVLCEDCKICHDHLVGSEDSALDELIKAILQEREAGVPEQDAMWHMGIRADAELLLTDGFLIRHMIHMMAADEEEEGGEAMDMD
ncbi:hypothetical protein BLS_002890 [Venturia inaequalis]|uniref:Zn(2)-C6 fungal-type domain-containing protein n=1 Tax=Venturia inaequalis TaxID=5025 RepID=A0A8H3UT63_VENIN|nr:hypothetical protein BLS_002890 [Venturia inaequalis]